MLRFRDENGAADPFSRSRERAGTAARPFSPDRGQAENWRAFEMSIIGLLLRFKNLFGGSDRYEPAKYYMRGPGPKALEKSALATQHDHSSARTC
jgi:hypothetical protein